MYQEIYAKTPLSRVPAKFPYRWDLNIYRGCTHKCKYCYAIYSHRYLDKQNFFGNIIVKKNIAELLDQKLSSKSWKGEVINIGSVTDSYQPLEEKLQIMPKIWEILIKHKNPVVISTKSKLILRDKDLIHALSKVAFVNIATTITCADESLRKIIEPHANTTTDRFSIVKEFTDINVRVGVHMMPLLPYISDTATNIDKLMLRASKARASYVMVGPLNLKGDTRRYYLEFIRNNYPQLYPKYQQLYHNSAYVNSTYRDEFRQKVGYYKKKHNFLGKAGNIMRECAQARKQDKKQSQKTLFDI